MIRNRTLAPDEEVSRDQFPANAIFFFDFDGVLVSQCEEKLYRLPERPGERARLVKLAVRVGIDSSLYNTQYLRHLVYQAMANEGCVPEPRFAYFLDEVATHDDPYFIITARSGLYAVNRVFDYINASDLVPQEVFCLGRGSKADLLASLLEEWPDREIVFFDDSVYNCSTARALLHPRLHVVEVQHERCTANAERLAAIHLGA